MKSPAKELKKLIIVLFCAATMGCATVSVESVQLSTLVGQRMASIQASHEAFVSRYFEASRRRVEDFLAHEWTPHFMSNFVQDAKLVELLNAPEPFSDKEVARLEDELSKLNLDPETKPRVVSSVKSAFGDAERGQVVLEFAQAAMKQIQAQRSELIEPLQAQEAKAIQEIRSSYAEIIAAQNAVTAHLSSMKKVTVAQDKLLERLGLLEARDKAVEKAVDMNASVVKVLNSANDVDTRLTKIKRLLDI